MQVKNAVKLAGLNQDSAILWINAPHPQIAASLQLISRVLKKLVLPGFSMFYGENFQILILIFTNITDVWFYTLKIRWFTVFICVHISILGGEKSNFCVLALLYRPAIFFNRILLEIKKLLQRKWEKMQTPIDEKWILKNTHFIDC